MREKAKNVCFIVRKKILCLPLYPYTKVASSASIIQKAWLSTTQR